MTTKLYSWACCAFVIGLFGCQDEKLITPEQRFVADTLYSNQLNALRLQGDSLCKLYQNSFYQQAIDSLQDLYLEELDYYFRK